mgnify:CR=1 FL=1
MYKIQSVNKVDTELLSTLSGAYEHVLLDMLKDFSKEMLRQGCLGISTEVIPTGTAVWDMNRTEFRAVGYVLSPEEFKEAVGLVKAIGVATGYTKENLAKRLLQILTEMPGK